jgi:hypothetical protein
MRIGTSWDRKFLKRRFGGRGEEKAKLSLTCICKDCCCSDVIIVIVAATITKASDTINERPRSMT